MATLKLDLSNLSVVGADGSKQFYIIDANKTNLKYAGYKVEAVSADGQTVTFADGSTLTFDTNKIVFTAASGTGTFDVGALDSSGYNTAKDAIVKQAQAVTEAAANVSGATQDNVVKALENEAAKYDKHTLNYVLFTSAAAKVKAVSAGDYTKDKAKEEAGKAEVTGDNSAAAIANITKLDFSNAGAVTYDVSKLTGLATLTGSAYADKLTVDAKEALTVTAGEGNDVVKVTKIADGKKASIDLGDGDDTLNITDGVTTGTAAVTLGDGKDVVNIASSTASVSISDYNYADGDKINLTYANASAALDNVALSTVNGETGYASIKVGEVTATVTVSDYVAAANISGGDKTVTFFTATDTAVTKTKEVEINAKGIANETRINATDSKLANITLGSGESKVTLADNDEADVINATGAGKATVTNFKDKKDTLILDGANLTNIKLAHATIGSATTGAELTYGKTTVDFAGTWNDDAKVINLNDSKLAFDLKDAGTVLAAGADMYFGNADTKTTVQTAGSVHLTETDKYRNIYNVSVTAGTKDEDKLDLSGFTTSGTTGINIDAKSSDVAVNVWAYNKNTKATDTITLSTSNNKQDTVSFVSDDGKVSVANFGFGTGEESDILYLRDTKDLQKLAVKSGEIKLGNSKATIGHATNVNDLMQVKLADGTTSLVAANFNTDTAKAGSIDVTLTSTQAVDFYALTGTKNTLTVTKASSLDDAVNFKYSNFDANHTTGTLVKSINASGFTNENDEVTIGAVANATVAGSTKSHIWVCGAAESGTVDVSGNSGKDQIDFVSGIDKKVTVTGYKAADDDTIYLRGAEDLKAVTAGYKFEYKNGGIQITGADNATSKLVLDGANKGELNLKTLNGSSLKAFVTDEEKATFSTDTKIYAGMRKLEADMSTEGDVAIRIGTKGEIGLDSSSTYYVDNKVTEFNGSNSNAVFHLAGSSTAATTLRGGNTKNSFYGGGSFNDKMVGNSSAVDTFYFGKGDGKDTIEEADGKDTVYLMNVTLEEISIDKDKKNVINIGANDTLTFGQGAEDALTAGELTFNIGGSNYVCKDGKFVSKEA